MSKKLIVANWKMNPATLAQADEIVAKIDEWLQVEALAKVPTIAICPPFVFIEEIAERLREGKLSESAILGAQDIGEVGADQLRSLGVRYVIVGHSDRRRAGDTDATVHEKLVMTLKHDLVPILCVETPEQAQSATAGLDGTDLARLCIAYEPVWAISTTPGAKPDTPENAAQAVAGIRAVVGSAGRTLYGGSITAANAQSFLSHSAFDGVLVGAASVRPAEFVGILSQAIQS